MRDLNLPRAEQLPRGATVLWANPTERTGMRWGLLALAVGSGLVGLTAGYFVGIAGMPSRNPRRRRRKKR